MPVRFPLWSFRIRPPLGGEVFSSMPAASNAFRFPHTANPWRLCITTGFFGNFSFK
jgi:hypothetical protein